MNLKYIIKLLTFIPWIIYFIRVMLYRISIIEEKDYDKKKYFSYINKNFFKSLNIVELFLFSIYVIFLQYKKTVVLEMLFPAIYLYLLINYIHAYKNMKKLKEKTLLVCTIIYTALIVGFFMFTTHLYTTYALMFISSIASSFLVYLFSFIKRDK